jgi:hypothetical protein
MDRITITARHMGTTTTLYLSPEDLQSLALAVADVADYPAAYCPVTRYGNVTVSKYPIPSGKSPIQRRRQP